MILFLKQIGVDFFIKCSFFSFSYMYFHTAYCKFTTMKILIIIFCNKIEEFCRHPKCDETPMPKSNGLHQLQPQ